ncbi:MAG: hypothetical protein NTW72_05035, partial [Gemmatimonadetes bacterium]|nr:hypothetical protein [Gemmatimonadota bacterium]
MSKILAVLGFTVLPYISCTVTCGCVAHATPALPPLGCVVKTSLFAAADATAIEVVTCADVTPALDAVRLKLPAKMVLHPENVAIPLTDVTGLVVHVGVGEPWVGGNVSWMLALLEVTVLPLASCTFTTGCTAHAAPAMPVVLGWVVKASLAAAPAT